MSETAGNEAKSESKSASTVQHQAGGRKTQTVNVTPKGEKVRIRHQYRPGVNGSFRLIGGTAFNPGGELLFNDVVGQEQDVSVEQAEYLLQRRGIYYDNSGNPRDIPLFVKVNPPVKA